jgi:opacity protein-like surface antigen
MRFIAPFLAALAALIPTAAFAEDDKGMYGSLDIGISQVGDVTTQLYDADGSFGLGTNGQPDTVDGSYDLKSAASFGASLGYDFGTVRADVEVRYARNTVTAISVSKVNGTAVTLDAGDAADFCTFSEFTGCSLSGANTIAFTGGPKLRQLSVMGNLWLDIPTGGNFVPYIGGGVGIVGAELDGEGKGKFAWQIGGGFALKASPSIAITADVRHRQVSGGAFPYDSFSGFSLGKVKTTTFGVGLRFSF